MKIQQLALVIGFLSCFSISTLAQGVIADRNALNALLGPQIANEDFEKFGITGGASQGHGLNGGLLSSTNYWGSVHGSNIVVSGVTISSIYSGDPDDGNYWLQWNASNIAGTVTRTILTSQGVKVDFWNPTPAFGIDLKDYPSFRVHFAAGVTVYGADDSTILYTANDLNITDPANGYFFGFQNPGGIGSVVFTTTVGDVNESPLIDNLSFGVVPEPSAVAFALLGLSALAFRLLKM